MSNGNIWGSSHLPNFMDQVMQAATWDTKMRMQREAQMMDILEQADPVKFMSYNNQNEQVTRLEELQQHVTTLARDRSGRFTTQDMMDVNFMVDEFETWQNKQLATLDVVKQDYDIFKSNLKDYDPIKGVASIENYQETGNYKRGDMLQIKPINPLYRAHSVLPPKGRKPIRQIPRPFTQDGVNYQEITSVWAEQEEREAAYIQDYLTIKGYKEGMDEMWDGLKLSEQQLWINKLAEYNITKKPNEPTLDERNPQFFMGLKTVATQYMRNTSEVKTYEYMQDKPPKEDKDKNKTQLVALNEGQATEFTRPVTIDGKVNELNYGEYQGFTINNPKSNKKLTLDETTFFSSIPPDGGNVEWYGEPASEATVVGANEKKTKLKGQAYTIDKTEVLNNMPVYIGGGEDIEKAWGEKTWLKSKKNIKLYPNQPIPREMLLKIKEAKGDNYDEWLEKNIEEKPVAIMSLKLSPKGGLPRNYEVMKVFDKGLATLLEVENPELILGQTLDDEEKKKKKETIVGTLPGSGTLPGMETPWDQYKR